MIDNILSLEKVVISTYFLNKKNGNLKNSFWATSKKQLLEKKILKYILKLKNIKTNVLYIPNLLK